MFWNGIFNCLAFFLVTADGVWTGGLEISFSPYENWAQQINNTPPFLITHPQSSSEVVSIVNWAYHAGRQVRVAGFRHSYPPITVSEEDDPSKIVIIDTTKHMNKLRLGSTSTIIAEPGASMEAFFTFAEVHELGIVMAPIIGDATIGGVLAVGGHGAGIPALNEKLNSTGYTFGSLSNAILELKAVVWSGDEHNYVIKTFSRNNPDISGFLVHIGRAIITEVTLMLGKNYNMRCISKVDVPSRELYAHPTEAASNTRTMSSLMDQYGRVDTIWYPFTESPWLKLWEVTPRKPPTSEVTLQPYNYQFTANELNPLPGPEFGQKSMQNLIRGLNLHKKWDIWGPSKNTILYYNGTSTPLAYSGFVVLTNRLNMQLVIHDIIKIYEELVHSYAELGLYPVDQYIKLRATGLDDPRETPIPGAVAADISPLSPIKSSNFNVGVWMNTLSKTRKPFLDEFMQKFESKAYSRFTGGDALIRPEWSKNWGHSETAPFENQEFLEKTVPKVYGIENWNRAVALFDKYDPHKVISNKFLRKLIKKTPEPTVSLKLIGGPGDHVGEYGWSRLYSLPNF